MQKSALADLKAQDLVGLMRRQSST